MSDTRLIKAASYSRIQIFEQCPHRAKLAYVERIPENERPPLPAGKEYANDRGNRVHDYAEFFVRGHEDHQELIPELRNFAPELYQLRALYAADPSSVIMENMWLFDYAWLPLPTDTDPRSKEIAMRIKLDVCVLLDNGTRAVVIDYKTGKRYGNEVKHGEQTQLYALAVFLRFPDVEFVQTELWYTDQNEIASMQFTRSQGLRYLKNWNNKLMKIVGATEFPKKPSIYTCRFCPYKTGLIGKQGPEGTGHCDKNPV